MKLNDIQKKSKHKKTKHKYQQKEQPERKEKRRKSLFATEQQENEKQTHKYTKFKNI